MLPLSDQMRSIIAGSGVSVYEIAKRAGIDQSALIRFVSGERGLSTPAFDALGQVFNATIRTKTLIRRRMPMIEDRLSPGNYRVRCVNNEFVAVIDSFPRDRGTFKRWEAAIRAKYEHETGKRITLTHYRAEGPDGRRRLPADWAKKFGFVPHRVRDKR